MTARFHLLALCSLPYALCVRQHMSADLLWQISVVLLAAVALSLLAPVFGAPMPAPWAIAALLGVRLGVQLWRSRLLGEGQNLLSLALSGLLLALLLFESGRNAF